MFDIFEFYKRTSLIAAMRRNDSSCKCAHLFQELTIEEIRSLIVYTLLLKGIDYNGQIFTHVTHMQPIDVTLFNADDQALLLQLLDDNTTYESYTAMSPNNILLPFKTFVMLFDSYFNKQELIEKYSVLDHHVNFREHNIVFRHTFDSDTKLLSPKPDVIVPQLPMRVRTADIVDHIYTHALRNTALVKQVLDGGINVYRMEGCGTALYRYPSGTYVETGDAHLESGRLTNIVHGYAMEPTWRISVYCQDTCRPADRKVLKDILSNGVEDYLSSREKHEIYDYEGHRLVGYYAGDPVSADDKLVTVLCGTLRNERGDIIHDIGFLGRNQYWAETDVWVLESSF